MLGLSERTLEEPEAVSQSLFEVPRVQAPTHCSSAAEGGGRGSHTCPVYKATPRPAVAVTSSRRAVAQAQRVAPGRCVASCK